MFPQTNRKRLSLPHETSAIDRIKFFSRRKSRENASKQIRSDYVSASDKLRGELSNWLT